MKTGYRYSLILHLTLCILCIVSFPSFRKIKSQDTIITIETLPISSQTNILKTKGSSTQQKPQLNKKEVNTKNSIDPKAVSKPTLDKNKEKKASPVPKSNSRKSQVPVSPEKEKKVKQSEPIIEEKISTPVAEPEKKKLDVAPEVDETPKKQNEDIQEEKVDIGNVKETKAESNAEEVKSTDRDFDSLFKDLAAQEDSEISMSDIENGANKDQYKEGLPLSLSEKDAIKSQIMRCWSIPAGGKDVKDMYVLVSADIEEDGTIKNIEIKEKSKYSKANENFYEVFVESAIRALQKCSPLQGLPIEKYDSWKKLELYFDPRELIY